MVERVAPPAHRPPPWELLALIGAMALCEIALALADRGLVFEPSLRGRVYTVGAFWASLLHGTRPIFDLQPWTMFISHAFLHGGFLHMAMNMAVLAGLGKAAADRYGAGVIVPTFVLGAVGGGVAFGLLSRSAVPMVGASGAVFAFLGLWIVADWRRLRARRASTGPIVTRVVTLVALNAFFFFALSGMLAWEAHLGGFLVGIGLGVIFENRRDARFLAAARRRRDGGL